MRILHPAAKAAVIITAIALAVMVPVAIVTFTQDFTLGILTILLLTVVVALFCARSFRGPSEEVAPPRAWWRMTEKPTAGFVVAGWFVLQSLTWGVPALWGSAPYGNAVAATSSAVYLLLALAFVQSSVRLLRADRPPRA